MIRTLSTRHSRILILLSLIILTLSAITAYSKLPEQPKNIIIMISDGMGFNHITATNCYQKEDFFLQQYQKFPIIICASTYLGKNINDNDEDWDQGYNSYKAWNDFEYLKHNPTGSAAAATAMATGKKTYKKSIGMDINKKPLYNISELAKDINKAAGVITTVQFSHATPAGFAVHNVHRDNYEQIAQSMILDSKLDVIMGCGHPFYDADGNRTDANYKYVGGEICWDVIKAGSDSYQFPGGSRLVIQDIDSDGKPDPWTLIETKADFNKYSQGDTPKRLIGVPQVAKTLQQKRSGDGNADAFEVPFNNNVPDLATMSKVAINVLDNDPDGFFLMIEGGAVDWASHDNQSGRMIEEMIDFNNAVDSVIAWVETNSSWDETLLIVTSDHECGYLGGPGSDPESIKYIGCNGKGNMPSMEWRHDGHTNQLVPFFAKGAGANLFNLFADETDMIRGPYINNTEIAQLVFLLWNK
jgi:alkaline phosphatase